MKLACKHIGLTVLGLAIAAAIPLSTTRADIPPLPADLPAGKSWKPLEVRVAPTKDISILRISRSALAEAGLEIRPTKQTGHWTPSTQRSIVAAMALSLGIAGVFLARKKRGAAIAVAMLAAGVAGTMGVHAWGNGPPRQPPPRPEQTPKAFWGTMVPLHGDSTAAHQPQAGGPVQNFNGKVVIEITDDDEAVRLFIGTKPEPKYRRVLSPSRD
jgi:hypothetical protein